MYMYRITCMMLCIHVNNISTEQNNTHALKVNVKSY